MTKEVSDLLTILCSSFYISKHPDEKLSISKASIDLHKITQSFQDEKEKALQTYDNFDTNDIEDPKFIRRLEHLENKQSELERLFILKVPFPVLKKNPAPGEGRFQINEQLTGNITHPIVQEWYEKYTDLGGNHCFLFCQNEIIESSEKLKKIGLYQIRINAMVEVIDEVSLEGSYSFYRNFDSVPDACRYFMGQVGKDYNREELKEKIGKYVQICENGVPISDWSIINARINSWWYHEENKYNRGKTAVKSA